MKRKVSLLLVPVLAVLLMASNCNTSKVGGFINLAVSATVNGLKLAQSFGATEVTDAIIAEAESDGSLLKSAYADWVSAAPGDKATKWAQVQAALDVFKNRLPEVLNAVHVSNPVYAGIAALAIQAIETVVDTILAQNSSVTGKKSAPHFDENQFKADYNAKMMSANHPELALK